VRSRFAEAQAAIAAGDAELVGLLSRSVSGWRLVLLLFLYMSYYDVWVSTYEVSNNTL
jgi:hypothetical protein